MHPEKFIRDSVIASFLLLAIVILTLVRATMKTTYINDLFR